MKRLADYGSPDVQYTLNRGRFIRIRDVQDMGRE